MTSDNGQWLPYAFPASLLLSVILLIVGVGLALAGRRLKKAVNLPHPGGALKAAIIIIWALSILILLRLSRARQLRFGGAIQSGPIFPITLASALCTFAYLAYIYRRQGFLTALGNALVGAAAGPMLFEFPFDWIVIPQIQAPTVYILFFFVPLFLGVLTTLSLLLLSRHVSIAKYSLYSLGTMFLVFAGWALVGFSYPSKPAPFLLNAISKVLSFTTVAALFSRKLDIPEAPMK